MTKLTLPLQVGKSYFDAEGWVVKIVSDDEDGWIRSDDGHIWVASTGRFFLGDEASHKDLVSDYIEPAKGHPHAASMAEFAKDAAESETPWDRWEVNYGSGDMWYTMSSIQDWHPSTRFRRKPTVTPDPHAATAAEYAKDMATSDKAWENWQAKGPNWSEWQDLAQHPSWYVDFQYRRRSL